MKAIHNIVTFLAALVVLSWAGWQTYLHWGVLKEIVVPAVSAKKCGCSTDCKCTDCKCTKDKKCGDNCKCGK